MSATTIAAGLLPMADAVVFADGEQLALVGFLAGYQGLTRQAYTIDLRQFTGWCTSHGLALFGVRRVDIECYARELEALGRARATVARRLCDPRTTMRYDRGRHSLDRHATYIVATWAQAPRPRSPNIEHFARRAPGQAWRRRAHPQILVFDISGNHFSVRFTNSARRSK